MAPAFWYGLLAFIGLVIFAITIWKVPNQRVIAIYTFTAGLIYCLEYVILILFKSYEYYPHILNNKYLDNILGSIFSNAIIVPMTATMIATLRLNWGWSLLAVGIILSIEKLFLILDIYHLFWWKIHYTAIGLIICFFLAKVWDKKLQGQAPFLVRLTTLFLSNFLFQTTLFFGLVAFGNLFLFQIGWFLNPIRDHFAFATIYNFGISFIFALLVIMKMKWKVRMAALFLITILNVFFLKVGVLYLSPHWSFIHFFILYLILLLLLEGFNRWCFSTEKTSGKTYR